MCGLSKVNIIAVTCGGANSMREINNYIKNLKLVLSDQGEVWTIGHNDYGQCGIGKAASEAR